MSKKVLIGTLVGAVASFLLGWVIFGMLLMDVYKNSMKTYEGLMYPEPILWAIFVAQVAWCWMTAWLWDRLNITDPMAGATNGAILFGAIFIGVDLMYYASMDLYGLNIMAIDIAANVVMGGIVGGIIAFAMGKVK